MRVWIAKLGKVVAEIKWGSLGTWYRQNRIYNESDSNYAIMLEEWGQWRTLTDGRLWEIADRMRWFDKETAALWGAFQLYHIPPDEEPPPVVSRWCDWDAVLSQYLEIIEGDDFFAGHSDIEACLRTRHFHRLRLAEWHNSRNIVGSFPLCELDLNPTEEREYGATLKEDWASAGGATVGGRMIAHVTDPIWQRLSDFGLPVDPLRIWNSGMVVDASRDKNGGFIADPAVDRRLKEPSFPELKASLRDKDIEPLLKRLRKGAGYQRKTPTELGDESIVPWTGSPLPDSAWPIAENVGPIMEMPWEQ